MPADVSRAGRRERRTERAAPGPPPQAWAANIAVAMLRYCLPVLASLPHFSDSSLISLPKSPGEPTSGDPYKLASCALMPELSRAALISLFSLLTISAGVFRGAHIPCHPIAS